MVYLFLSGLNQAANICKKKLFRLWISCVYLLVNLWCAGSACALKLFCNGPSGRMLRWVMPR